MCVILSSEGEGDMCLVQRSKDCRTEGALSYVVNSELVGVCNTSFGYLEAHVACSTLGVPIIHTFSSTL